MYLVWGEMVKSEAWAVMSSSLERAVAQSEEGNKLTGMSSQAAREDHLRTLLLLPALGLLKPCALETYSGTVLGQLSRRKRPYSGPEMNHFILSCVRLDWVEPATADVARWGTQLWADDPANENPYRYWDWHVKTGYSDYHLPLTKHGTSKRIVYARKQLMLHDQAGHLLLVKTHRADTNLIEGMVVGTAYYEGIMESRQLTHQIFDREGLSVAHFKEMQQEEPQRHFITYLRSNQYEGEESFEEPSSFEPCRYDRKGQVIQEIAEAQYKLKDRRSGEEDLPVRAILLRKPIAQDSAETAKLMVNVTLDQELEADEVARLYQARKVAQENAIRNWWNPLGGDVNVGYAKQPVENSELAKDKADLEKSLNSLADRLVACQKRLQKTQQKQQRLTEQYLTALKEAQQKLLVAAQSGQEPGGKKSFPWGQAEKIRLEAELAGLYQQVETAGQKVEEELVKRQRYRQQEAEKKESLTKISQAMVDKPMYQLDDRKDQLMGALRSCLTNVLQHLRDVVFPISYAQATFNTLANFIRMGGYIIEQSHYIEVILDGFWQVGKRRDLAVVVARCNERQYTAPDGRPLRFGICRVPGYI
jgi:hypothetical protein